MVRAAGCVKTIRRFGASRRIPVMTGLVPVIHDFNLLKFRKSWMAGAPSTA
jgi:hypothetical protein